MSGPQENQVSPPERDASGAAVEASGDPTPPTDEQKRLSSVQNEKTKLRATYLNGLAIAILAVGGFAPIASYLSSAAQAHYAVVLALAASCVVISFVIHKVAQRGLGDMVS